MNSQDQQELKEDFEANLLDGDAVQGGQMIASEDVWAWLAETLEPRWWVVDHTTDTKYAGPFTTAADAGKARTILERFDESDRNYWIQKAEIEGEKP